MEVADGKMDGPESNPGFDEVGMIIEYETDGLDTEGCLELFGHLIRNGHAWTLQGHYGRTARSLIDQGYLTKEGGPGPKHFPDPDGFGPVLTAPERTRFEDAIRPKGWDRIEGDADGDSRTDPAPRVGDLPIPIRNDGGRDRTERLANNATARSAMLPCRCGSAHPPGYYPTVDLSAGKGPEIPSDLAWLDRGAGACFPTVLPACGPTKVRTEGSIEEERLALNLLRFIRRARIAVMALRMVGCPNAAQSLQEALDPIDACEELQAALDPYKVQTAKAG